MTRPRSGGQAAQYEDLARNMVHLDIGIALGLLHQWFPGGRRGLWISETSLPDIVVDGDHSFQAAGTITYARVADDAPVATARYQLSARREGSRWRVVLLTIEEQAASAFAAAI